MFIDLYTYYIGYLWQDKDLALDEAEVDRESMVYPLRLGSTHHLHYAGIYHCYCIHLAWSSSIWLGVCYDTQPWVYGVRVSAFIPASVHPSAHSISTPPAGGKDYTSLIPSSTPSPTPSQPGSQGAKASLSNSLIRLHDLARGA